MKLRSLVAAVLLSLVESPAFSQTQTIIAPSRSIDWSQAGIPGGIPDRTTICATLNPGATAAQINAAIAACSNGVVYLNAGTYNLSTGITFAGRDNVTLRGAGPTRTILKVASPDGCGGYYGNICIEGSSIGTPPPSSNIHNWTAGFGKSATQITLDSASGISVGSALMLDQLDDASDPGAAPYISCSSAVSQENCPVTRTGRSQQQIVKVVSVSGNQVTISPGLHMPNWRASQQPQVWWWGESAEMNGIEDLTLDDTNGTETAGIVFRNAYTGWVKNIRSMNSNRNHIWVFRSARIEVRDSYFYGNKSSTTLSYGVESYMTSDSLVINNIFQHVSRPIMMGPASGSVYAYNYGIDMYYTTPAGWMNATFNGSHDAGVVMNLFEGNIGTGFLADLYHGTGALPTLFRNRFSGKEPGKGQNTSVINIWGYNRLANIVGNVLGTGGYHTKYEDSHVAPGTPGSNDTSIYLLGYTGVDEQTPLGYDPGAVTTMLRWGNYDYVTGQTQWNAAEIPAGNPVPSTHTLPASMFLSSRPAWWGTMPWPAIGPDVTGGDDPSGHAHRNPAQVCYESTPFNPDGTLAFDARQCYASAPPDSLPPSAPANLAVTSVSASQVNLTWTASTDDVAVVGYRVFRCQGGCVPAAQIGTTPTPSYSDAGLSPSTAYTYAVVAYDAAGNVSASSALVSAMTAALPPATLGLVAAYGFDEGTGSVTADSSPNHNAATISGAVWGAGKFGGSLSFDGAASFVEAADIDPITPLGDATFQAWVYLQSAPTEVGSIFNKWAQTSEDEYIFGINPNRTLYVAWHTTGGSTWPTASYRDASGAGQIMLTTWTHVAVVRSGTSLRFYINGVLDTTLTGVMDANAFRNGSTTIRMGGQGRGGRGRFFTGLVDDARIYNRALSQAEIQQYMTAAVSGKPGPPKNVRIIR